MERLKELVFTIPVTLVVIFLCIFFWIVIHIEEWSFDDVGLNYEKVVEEKETWRWITASLSHISFLHLLMNVYSLWTLRIVEEEFSSFVYFQWSLLIAVLSSVVTLFIYFILLVFFQQEHVRYIYMIGYSAVIFGILTIASQRLTNDVLMIFQQAIPFQWAPLVLLFFTTLLVPQASLIGHCSGILIGYAIDGNLFWWISYRHHWWVFVFLTCVMTLAPCFLYQQRQATISMV